MNENSYDAIVLGAGIGGLVAAATLTQKGLKVAVFEARHHPGGYCTSFKRPGPFTFNSAISSLSALNPTGWLGSILQQLGIYQPQDYIKLETLKDLIFPRHNLRILAGARNFKEQLISLFPAERPGIEETFQVFEQIHRELQTLTAAQLEGSLNRVSFPSYSRYKNFTLGQLLDAQLQDPELKGLIAGQCFYMGSPPSRASLVAVASMLMAYLEDGTYHMKGGAQALPDLLTRYIRERGGEVHLRRPVEAILMEAGQVRGALVKDQGVVKAPRVISNLDLIRTLAMLPPDPAAENYRRRIGNLKLSPSYFKVYLGVDLPLHKMNLPPHIDYFSTYDIEEIFSLIQQGNYSTKILSYDISIPSLSDDTLAPAGKHALTITLLTNYHACDWKGCKEKLRDWLITQAGEQIPGLEQGIQWKDAATPLTMERFTGNSRGAAYGWEQIPEQMGGRRIPPLTPIQGLYLAGHWTTPGGGVASAAVSGMLTAKEILKKI